MTNQPRDRPSTLTGIATLVTALVLSGCQPQPTAPSNPPATDPTSVPVAPPQAMLQPLAANAVTPDAQIQAEIDRFLQNVTSTGALAPSQGLWMQTQTTVLASYQGTTPLSAASLTKVATSLAALKTLGPQHQFTTRVGITGTLKNGVVMGDLVIQGDANPFFVWEDSFALASLLQQQGIQRVQGNLVVTGAFYMNFAADPLVAGSFLMQGLDRNQWPFEAQEQFQTLPPDTPQPQLVIEGTVQISATIPNSVQWLEQHRSYPLSELLKRMNRYSNNDMAEMIARTVGGPQQVTQAVLAATGLPPNEVQLVNGSGLATENRLSPRAACTLFLAINQLLAPQGMTVADIFTVTGQDEGVLDGRSLPVHAVVKSGTLDTVSALAGALPTQSKDVVWFAIINNSGDVDTFRLLQEGLLADLVSQLGQVSTVPAMLRSTPSAKANLAPSQLWTAP